MLTFLKRRKYKNDVRLSMSYLLGLDTQGYTSHDVLRLYPKVFVTHRPQVPLPSCDPYTAPLKFGEHICPRRRSPDC
jgi:hypothetical protein